ncbi:hypothetical protein ACELLULO517_15655 [Acidisoma cellulosilytica]|uniref:Uncharacterized protein n=1 Tax=Acidisoma cellulosilyticum TaxID=2802395 RepID=A0A963Z2K6_9PROT|nr:hypothetical protein [Acidisoma cellulosilyticum]MCB8881683.1 hypothetical protein [Acidisoma cellulosilyticum]
MISKFELQQLIGEKLAGENLVSNNPSVLSLTIEDGQHELMLSSGHRIPKRVAAYVVVGIDADDVDYTDMDDDYAEIVASEAYAVESLVSWATDLIGQAKRTVGQEV